MPSVQSPPLLTTDVGRGPTVVWKKPRLLELRYDEARIHHFHNSWHHGQVEDFHYVVELQLAPSTNEFALPFTDRRW